MKKMFFAVLVLLALGVSMAQAAVPVSISTMFTDIQTDGLAVLDLAIPVIAAVLGVLIVIKLAKRGMNKI